MTLIVGEAVTHSSGRMLRIYFFLNKCSANLGRVLVKCKWWWNIHWLIQPEAGLSPQRIFWSIFKTFQIVKEKEHVCLSVVTGLVTNQLSDVEIKPYFKCFFKGTTTTVGPAYLVINLAGTARRCRACINFSGPPHTFPQAYTKKTRSVVSFSSPA